MPLQQGELILAGKYHLLRLIGEGGMARVWLAQQPHFGDLPVSIKEPRTGLLPRDEEELQRRWRQEVEVCAALERARVPCVVRTLTLELLPDGTQLLVLAYMEGGSVSGLLAERRDGLPLEQAIQIARDVLEALAGFHDLPAAPVHRDVKPENILLDGEGRAYLGDFGLAQLPGQSGRSQLRGGTHPGTPLYMAPEQARSPEPLTPAADLYSLGCVLFEMLTGQRYRRVRPGTAPSTLRAEVPAWLDGLLARALAEDPWDRWQSAAEMAGALEAGWAGEREAREAEERRKAEEARRQEVAERAEEDRLAGLAGQARSLLACDPEGALALLAEIRAIRPGYAGLADLEREARSALSARRREAEASQEQARRTTLRGQVEEALLARDWGRALRLADQLGDLGGQARIWAASFRKQAEAGRRAEARQAREGDGGRPAWHVALAGAAVALLLVGLGYGVYWLWGRPEPTATAEPTTQKGGLPWPADTATALFSLPALGVTTPEATALLSDGVHVGASVTNASTAALRVRSQPGSDSEVVSTIASGTLATVIDGPEQADGYTWWKVRLADGREGWAAGDFLQVVPGAVAPQAPPPSCSYVDSTWRRPADDMTMLCVPEGEFPMGTSDAEIDTLLAANPDWKREWFADEQPQHEVYVDAFWIDRTEVTNEQYRRCVDAGACGEPACWDSDYFNSPGQPVVCVTWYDAEDYCAWAGARLPTEAEWEKASSWDPGREEKRIYPWGDAAPRCELATFVRCDVYHPSAAGTHPDGASAYGALDMAGNVWEWCEDWYDVDRDTKVLRGGAWAWDFINLRSVVRIGNVPDFRADCRGFRCSVTPTSSP